MNIKIKLKEGAIAPSYASSGDAGMDLYAYADAVIGAKKWGSVPTGVYIELPPGFEAQVRPRSGLAIRHGVTVLNAPGTIDAGYRGEICVILINHGDEPYQITAGDRIAQMVVAPVSAVQWEICAELSDSERGTGGFGSSGK